MVQKERKCNKTASEKKDIPSRWKTTTDMVYLIGMADISRRSNPKTGIPALFRRSISVTTPKYFMTDRFVVKTT
ncbi:hypothetical protein ACI3PL_02550, partial [Lacticaseibacillus paracasei]